MAEYKPKIKDVALAAMDGVRELREEFANMRKHIAVIDNEVFKKMHYDTDELNTDNDTYDCCPKVDNSVHIYLADFAKNKCPHCGSHNLHFTFNPDAFSDSTVNCRDCHNSWKVGGCDEDIDSPYEVANKLRREHCILFAKNADLQEENEKLKQQATIDASYMVTVEDLMARLKSREERIEALKQENNKLESKKEELKNELEKARDHIKTQKSNIALLADKNKKLENGLEIAKRKLELQLLSNTPIQFDPDSVAKINALKYENLVLTGDNDFLRHEIDEYKDKIDVLKDEKRNLQKENEELQKEIVGYRDAQYDFKTMKKALNIYQDITTLDVYLDSSTGFISLTDLDTVDRVAVEGSDLDTLCDAYVKFHQYAKKETK